MRVAELITLIKMDVSRWNGRSFINLFFLKREFRLVYRLRLCQFFRTKPLLLPLSLIERFLYNRITVKCGCDIPSSIAVGGGFQLLHSWGTVINSNSVIGKNCTILTGSIIGKTRTGVPIIGDNVYIGAHAIIIGHINIGNNATIGAGAIVLNDVPNDAVIIGEKAHILRK